MSVNVTIYEGKQQRSYTGVKKLQLSNGALWVPEADVIDPIYQHINTSLYGSVTLADNTFIFSDTLSFLLNTKSATLDFTSYNISYSSLSAEMSNGASILKYDSTIVYSSTNGWLNDRYKKIAVEGGTDATNPDFILWLLGFGQLPLDPEDRFNFDINLLCATIKKRSGWSENETIRGWAKHVPT